MNRTQLSEWFHALCPNVYFQPPSNVQLKYPCIIYERRSGDSIYADDSTYQFTYSYTITYIDSNPDSTVPEELAKLPFCKLDRCFTSDNLYHTTFIVYH